MQNDLIQRLSKRAEVAREIVATARRARRLRSLYKLIQSVEADRRELDADTEPRESEAVCNG